MDGHLGGASDGGPGHRRRGILLHRPAAAGARHRRAAAPRLEKHDSTTTRKMKHHFENNLRAHLSHCISLYVARVACIRRCEVRCAEAPAERLSGLVSGKSPAPAVGTQHSAPHCAEVLLAQFPKAGEKKTVHDLNGFASSTRRTCPMRLFTTPRSSSSAPRAP